MADEIMRYCSSVRRAVRPLATPRLRWCEKNKLAGFRRRPTLLTVRAVILLSASEVSAPIRQAETRRV